jgi:hypothetical protein
MAGVMNSWHVLVAILLKGWGIDGAYQIGLKNILILRRSDCQGKTLMNTMRLATGAVNLPLREALPKTMVGHRGLPIVGGPLTVHVTCQITPAMAKHLRSAISGRRKRSWKEADIGP